MATNTTSPGQTALNDFNDALNPVADAQKAINSAGGIGNAAQDVTNALNPTSWFTSLPWARIGWGALGVLMIIIGIIIFVSDDAKDAAMTAGKFIAQNPEVAA